MTIIGIIPARFKSTRYPGKPLVSILDKPLVIHVAERAAIALGKDNVFVATDDKRIASLVENYGYKFILTSDTHPTGTDRLWEVAKNIKADIYINIQGDEPMVDPNDILNVAKLKQQFPNYVINGMCELGQDEDPLNKNIPKVLVNSKNDLIYMSRLPIPGIKTETLVKPKYLKQVCIYGFSYEDLKAYGLMAEKAEFEFFEDIEILRFLELGIPIKMTYTSGNTIAVDVPEDVLKVTNALANL